MILRATKILLFLLVFSAITGVAQRNPEYFKRYAIKQMRIGKYSEAIDVLNKYIAQNPQKADGYNLRGLCYEAQEMYNYAVLDFRRAHALDPNDPEIKKNLNRVISVWYKILEKKIEGHKRELAINPESAFDYLEIGKCYRWMEKWNLAEQWYDEYLKRDPNASPDEIIRYTEILAKTRHIKKGEKILKKYVERYPDDWRLWSRYGYFTLWLGKYKTAEDAFQTALSFKPFFKEAEDGLDLARRKGYLTQYHGRSYDKVYLIDKYYRILRRNPQNDEIRFRLVDELLNKKRYAEAKDQLDILAEKHAEETRYKKLKERLEKYYQSEIVKKEKLLEKDPTNREAVLAVAENYMNLEKYDKALEILNRYIEEIPDDLEARYLLAKTYMLLHEEDKAYEIIKSVLDDGGNQTKYKLLAGQLGVWTMDESEKPAEYLKDVLREEPKNITAAVALGLYYYNKDVLDSVEYYVDLGKTIDKNDKDLQELENMLELLKLKKEYEKYLIVVREADSLAREGDYREAIEKYNYYFDKPSELNMNDYPVLLSLASCYASLNEYDSAAYVYDKALEINDDPQIKLAKAKMLFWAGDSTEALNEFLELEREGVEAPEVKVYLGDLYVRLAEYDSAKTKYLEVPDSLWDTYYIERRLSWLPPEEVSSGGGFFSTLGYDLFSYLYLNPQLYYFNDLLDFTYAFIGLRASTGLFRFLSVGAGYRYGLLSDGNYDNYFHRVMIYLDLVPSKKLSFSFGFGKMFGDYYDRREYEFVANYQDSSRYRAYKLYGLYQYGDGAEIFYSPYLVPYKITGELYKIGGHYNFRSGLVLRGFWSFLHAFASTANGNNWGNEFLLRLGRRFHENYIIGYELDYIDFQFTSSYYYSPQEYISHSIWGEWKFYDEDNWILRAGGRIGYVPQTTYFIWDGRIDAEYHPYKNLFVTAFAFYGQSQRYYLGYRSKAFGVSVSWSPF